MVPGGEAGSEEGDAAALSSGLPRRLVTGVVLLGGMGGEGLAGTRLEPPVAWARSAVGLAKGKS